MNSIKEKVENSMEKMVTSIFFIPQCFQKPVFLWSYKGIDVGYPGVDENAAAKDRPGENW